MTEAEIQAQTIYELLVATIAQRNHSAKAYLLADDWRIESPDLIKHLMSEHNCRIEI